MPRMASGGGKAGLQRDARVGYNLMERHASCIRPEQEMQGFAVAGAQHLDSACCCSLFGAWKQRHGLRDGRKIGVKSGMRIDAVVKRSPKRLKYAAPRIQKERHVLYLEIDQFGSNLWKLEQVVSLLKDGAVGVIPTDTVYAIVCDLPNRAAIERLYRIKNIDAKKPLSILCRSFQDIDKYTLGFPCGDDHGKTNYFRAARQCLPGPYTFILPASKDMPKQCTRFGGSVAASYAPRKSVGIRIPDDPIWKTMSEHLDNPLLCTSVRKPADDEWLLDPAVIADTYGFASGREGVDFVVDGGVRVADPSTVVDMTTTPVLLRRGKGIVEDWMVGDTTQTSEMDNPYA